MHPSEITNRESDEFLKRLCCPVSLQRLAPAPEELTAALEAQRRAGSLRFQGEHPQFGPGEPIEAVLLREDGQVGYPVQKGVPLLLPGHGIMV